MTQVLSSHVSSFNPVQGTSPFSNDGSNLVNASFVAAAKNGHLNQVLEVLSSTSVNYKTKIFALCQASFQGHDGIVLALLDHGADVNGYDGKDTPLHLAASKGFVQIVQLLLERGANPNVTNASEKSPLHMAYLWGDSLPTMRLLLQHGANPNVNTNVPGMTLLHHAVWHRRLAIVQVLLEYGAAVNKAVSRDNNTVLHVACVQGIVDMVRLLLQHGADVTAEDWHGRLPIFRAAQMGNLETVLVLLEHQHGVNNNSCCFANYRNSHGETVLEYAIRQNVPDTRILEAIVTRGAANVLLEDASGKLPLFIACEVGNINAVRLLLLECGVDPNYRNMYGDTALHHAVLCPKATAAILQALLAQGADPTLTGRQGKQPLSMACEVGNLNAVYLLVHREVGDGSVGFFM